MSSNLIQKADAYKVAHWLLNPPGTSNIHAYLESRGGRFDYTVFFGLQSILKRRFQNQIITQTMINEMDVFSRKVFMGHNYFNRQGWEYILKEHGGHFPIRVKAVPEGSRVPTSNVLFTVENTDENPLVSFIAPYLEDNFMHCWYPTTVATLSHEIKRLIKRYAEECGCEVSPFHLNDFGLRGVTGFEQAEIGGAAHLVNFQGTDNLPAIQLAMDDYHTDVCGFSIMASEHNSTLAFGPEGELAAYTHFLDKAPDDAFLSVVIDTYDPENAVKNLLGGKLHDRILARKGKVVFRPDSGDPVQMCVDVVTWLGEKFGYTTREHKGSKFKVLVPQVGVIYGDGINYDEIRRILEALVKEGWCVSNVVFGCGGGLLQDMTRDTQRFAFKASEFKIGNEVRPTAKKPKSDFSKSSKSGRFKLAFNAHTGFSTVPANSTLTDTLVTVWENGKLMVDDTFDKIRARAASSL